MTVDDPRAGAQAPAPTTGPAAPGGTRLTKDAIGGPDLVFFVVAAAAPLTVMAGVAPLAIALGGLAAPLGYLLAGVVLVLFAMGFTAMSHHVRNAGAFYAYIGRGLGRVAGAGAAFVAVLSYNLIQIGLLAAFGFFAATTVSDLFGLAVGWQVWSLLGLVLIGVLGYLRVTFSARLLGIVLALEVLILLVFEGGVLLGGAPEGLSLAPFNPANLISSGAAAMLVLSVGAFIGFEATAIYAEEVRDARRTVPWATYVAVGFLAVFYTFTVWVIIMSVGASQAVAVAQSDAGADMVFTATEAFVGPWASDAMRLLIVTSAFAASLAFHNAAVRYLYALGREGLLPAALGRTDARTGSPSRAVLVQSLLALAVIGVGIAADADPYLVILLWTNGPGILGIVALQALAAVAAVAFFRRDRHGYSAARVVVAPAVAAAALTVVVVLVVTNFSLLTDASWTVNAVLLLPVPLVFAWGAWQAARIRRDDPARYATLTTTDVERDL
jgi:amino acid transporter